jgi:STE24 endopeptidase
MASVILYAIIAFIIVEFLITKTVDVLNLQTWDKPIPNELKELYSNEQFEKAKAYAKANAKLKTLSGTISFFITIGFLWFKGFAWIDALAASVSANNIVHSLVFFAIIGAGNFILQLPFSLYSTFLIEQQFGFNKTTVSTFIADTIKTILLSAVIGGGLLALLAFLFQLLGDKFWVAGWLIVSAFTLFFAAFYTTIFLPLFNKLSPLGDGDLRTAIEQYAAKVSFPLTNIFVIDGSKRSAKANAFFSGLGGKKNIVLYDTLIKDLSQDEITAVLAHEVGHYKKKHIQKSIALSVLQIGVMFFVFGWLASNPLMAEVLGAEKNNFHLSLITFSLLFSPVSLVTGILMHIYSRKNEYEADAYAKETFAATPLITALKKLTINHLGNPQPHPAFIFLHYSHPTLLQRMKALE